LGRFVKAGKPNSRRRKQARWFSPLELHVLPKLGKSGGGYCQKRYSAGHLGPILATPKRDRRQDYEAELSIVIADHAARWALRWILQATKKSKALARQDNATKVNERPAVYRAGFTEFYQSLATASQN